MTTGEAFPHTQTKQKLPPDWRWVRLGGVGRFESGGTPPKEDHKYWGGKIPFVTGADITEFIISAKHARAFLTEAGLASGRTAVCNPGTVLIVTRTRVGRAAITAETMGASQDLTPYICGPEIDPEYACRYLLSISDFLLARCRGSTVQGLTREFVDALEIPLSPLQEQKRITAILNKQMAAVERARAAAQVQLQTAKALPAACLRAVFNSPEAQQWPMTRVSQICDSIDYGFTASADYEVRELRFLRITDIQDGSVDWEKVPGCRINSDEESRYRLMDGDIVFARTGATTGKSYLMRHPPRAVFASYLIRIRPSPAVTAEYLYAFFQSDRYWQQIRAAMRGGAQPNVNATLLGALALPLPSLSEQRQIAPGLSEEMAVAEALRKRAEEQLHAINALPAALLRRAFSGEL